MLVEEQEVRRLMISQKEIYKREFEERYPELDSEEYIWAEELAEKKIILYASSIKEIPQYNQNKSIFHMCRLIYIDNSQR